jgi:hypothetical protein
VDWLQSQSSLRSRCYIHVFASGEDGGLHGGEPLSDGRLTKNPPYTPGFTCTQCPAGNMNWPTYGWDSVSGGWAYSMWIVARNPYPAGGDNTVATIMPQPVASNKGNLRPSYTREGVAVEFMFDKCIFRKQYDPWRH